MIQTELYLVLKLTAQELCMNLDRGHEHRSNAVSSVHMTK